MTRYAKIAAAIVALALTVAPAVAQAHNWVVLDGGTRACEVPGVGWRTPYQFEMGARAAGIFKDTDVMRDDNGVVQAVAVKVLVNRIKRAVVYFRSLAYCRAGLTAMGEGTAKELN